MDRALNWQVNVQGYITVHVTDTENIKTHFCFIDLMFFFFVFLIGQFLHFHTSSNFLCCVHFQDIGSETGEEQHGLLLPRTQPRLEQSLVSVSDPLQLWVKLLIPLSNSNSTCFINWVPVSLSLKVQSWVFLFFSVSSPKEGFKVIKRTNENIFNCHLKNRQTIKPHCVISDDRPSEQHGPQTYLKLCRKKKLRFCPVTPTKWPNIVFTGQIKKINK